MNLKKLWLLQGLFRAGRRSRNLRLESSGRFLYPINMAPALAAVAVLKSNRMKECPCKLMHRKVISSRSYPSSLIRGLRPRLGGRQREDAIKP